LVLDLVRIGERVGHLSSPNALVVWEIDAKEAAKRARRLAAGSNRGVHTIGLCLTAKGREWGRAVLPLVPRQPCPCCRHLTLWKAGHNYEICPVCFWEDDGQDDSDADVVRGGPNGRLSLTEARRSYREIGATDRYALKFVRPPEAYEQSDAPSGG